jgi:hypothetical protein
MSLRIIWQYMDRSVTKKILYGPQSPKKYYMDLRSLLRSIQYFFGDGPVHILPYDPQCHELFAIYITLRLLKLYFYIADVVEWSRALDIRLSDWCCSVSMV